ncbi:hypothetical protein [Thermomonas fusca]|uniref:Uncharacterized protein n=1 Tax=Thermomonas fusca TaxID=215690 RepID=A0A5R9PI82_9GAMM|nr:hypothetical protein [Thermomonas fusca]TLX22703.1 hypothetical protein E5S66_01335 [Thermomonas fusca]
MRTVQAVDKQGIESAVQNHPQLFPCFQGGYAGAFAKHKTDLKQKVTVDIPGFSLLQHHRLSRFIHIQEARASQPARLSNQPKG